MWQKSNRLQIQQRQVHQQISNSYQTWSKWLPEWTLFYPTTQLNLLQMHPSLRKLLTWSVKSKNRWTMCMDLSRVQPSLPWDRPWTRSVVLSKILALHTTSSIQCSMIKSNRPYLYFQVIALKNSCQHSRTKDIKNEVQSRSVIPFFTVKFLPESQKITVK